MIWEFLYAGLVAMAAAMFASWLILVTRKMHGEYSLDHDTKGVQKYHTVAVPRIGGIALFTGLAVGSIFHGLQADDQLHLSKWAGVAALPVFLGGLVEDVSKKMSARDRLLLAFLSAAIGYYELGIGLHSVGWEAFDQRFLVQPGASLILTLVMVGGVAHSTNIIDGFHGLLIGVALLVLGAFLWVMIKVNEHLLVIYTMILFGSLAGIFIFNFPKGKLFLGDGGAYLIGFLLAVLALLLVNRHPRISPWFPLLVMAYPVVETIFSIIRKKIFEGRQAMAPDEKHLHMLVFERLSASIGRTIHLNQNAVTSVVMWLVALVSIVPGVLFWDNTVACLVAFCGFCFFYTFLYISLSSGGKKFDQKIT